MVRAAIPHIGVRRIACGSTATDADHCGAASPPPLFQAPGHDAGQRQEWKYTGTRGSRLTHRFGFDGSGWQARRPRSRDAHYGGVFDRYRHTRYVVSLSALSRFSALHVKSRWPEHHGPPVSAKVDRGIDKLLVSLGIAGCRWCRWVSLPRTAMRFAGVVSRESCASLALAVIECGTRGVALRSLRAVAASRRPARSSPIRTRREQALRQDPRRSPRSARDPRCRSSSARGCAPVSAHGCRRSGPAPHS